MDSIKREFRSLLDRATQKYNNATLSTVLILFGGICVISSLGILLFTFYPVIQEELKYAFSKKENDTEVVLEAKPQQGPARPVITPTDSYFGIVIPKIGANAKVIQDVNPYKEDEYQWQLTQGVAHAKGTSLPGEAGNVFLFAHSAGNFYQANRYNAIFYLLNKLEKDDKIYVFHYKQRFQYKVKEIKLVNADEVEYLQKKGNKHTLTLMTCWPAGTTLQRLLIIAEEIKS